MQSSFMTLSQQSALQRVVNLKSGEILYESAYYITSSGTKDCSENSLASST